MTPTVALIIGMAVVLSVAIATLGAIHAHQEAIHRDIDIAEAAIHRASEEGRLREELIASHERLVVERGLWAQERDEYKIAMAALNTRIGALESWKQASTPLVQRRA